MTTTDDSPLPLSDAHPFAALSPDVLLDAVESAGYLVDGRLLALNSYENRVYQVGIDEQEPLIAKFYRPARWTDQQILEEHQFSYELQEQELPIVCPLKNDEGESLFHFRGFRFSLFPRRGGRAPDLDNLDNLYSLGQLLGRIHLVGSVRPFEVRPALNIESFGEQSVRFISENFIPADLKESYDTLTRDLLAGLKTIVEQTGPVKSLRVHGDCHPGNILWREEAPNFVDLDDARMAPAIQDIWMLLSGDKQQQQTQLMEVMDGYGQFNDFDVKELRLIEVYRSLRIMHFSAWLARRWEDPAFPQYFPWFNSPRYWGEHILQLREQMAALTEPPLQLNPYR